jgi:hypothetical protein
MKKLTKAEAGHLGELKHYLPTAMNTIEKSASLGEGPVG